MRNLKNKIQAIIDRLENKKTYYRKNLNTIKDVNKSDSVFATGFITGINIAINKVKLLMDEVKLSIVFDEQPDEMYIVYAMHREREYCGGMSWVGESYIVKNEEKAELLAKILQSVEKDDDITWEILDMYNTLHINDGDKISLDKNNELTIIPGKIDDKVVRKQVSITNGELEILEDWEELPDNTYEDAVVNGIIRQIKPKKRSKNETD